MRKSFITVLSLIFLLSSAALSSGAGAASDAAYEARVNAQAMDKEQRIREIFDQRARLLVEQPEGYEIEYEKLGRQLQRLGVEFLTHQEVQQKLKKHERDLITPMVTLPSQNNIVWTSFRNNWVKNGITYEVQHVGAEPNSLSSNLKGTGGKLVQSTYQWQAGAMNVAKVFVSEAAGALNSKLDIAITVYETARSFLSDIQPSTVVTDIKANYTWTWIENVDFMFVKKAGQSDSSQYLSYISTEVSGTLGWYIPTFSYKVSGAIQSTSLSGETRSFKYTGAGHRNGSYAVNNYVDPYSHPDTGYVPDIPLEGPENKVFYTINTLKPVGMAHVY